MDDGSSTWAGSDSWAWTASVCVPRMSPHPRPWHALLTLAPRHSSPCHMLTAARRTTAPQGAALAGRCVASPPAVGSTPAAGSGHRPPVHDDEATEAAPSAACRPAAAGRPSPSLLPRVCRPRRETHHTEPWRKHAGDSHAHCAVLISLEGRRACTTRVRDEPRPTVLDRSSGVHLNHTLCLFSATVCVPVCLWALHHRCPQGLGLAQRSAGTLSHTRAVSASSPSYLTSTLGRHYGGGSCPADAPSQESAGASGRPRRPLVRPQTDRGPGLGRCSVRVPVGWKSGANWGPGGGALGGPPEATIHCWLPRRGVRPRSLGGLAPAGHLRPAHRSG